MSNLILDDQHRYFLDGRRLPSVTQMLSALGLTDYSAPWFNDEAKARGTYLHTCIELIEQDDLVLDSVDPSMQGEVAAFAEWKEMTGFTSIWAEKSLHSKIYGFAGTPDAFGVFPDGRYALIEWKRGAALPAVAYQLALYAILIAEGQDHIDKFQKPSIWNIKRFTIGNISKKIKMIEHKDKADIEVAKSIVAVYHSAFNKGIFK